MILYFIFYKYKMSDILVVDTLINQEKISNELSHVKQELALMKDRLLSQTIEEEKLKQEMKEYKEDTERQKRYELEVLTMEMEEKMKHMEEEYQCKITEMEGSFTQCMKEQKTMYQNKIRELERELDSTSFFSMI